jgi:hypothetical protein
MKELEIKVTAQQLQLIIDALGELPHRVSRELIDNLISQGQEQLKEEK